jgi:hypothetical protein
LAFDIPIDKDEVRRILAAHYRPEKDSGGPSWLTFIGHMKDSLWSVDLFRCESATLRTHWVLVVMDQYTRRIIGFGVHAGTVDGVALCRIFNRATRRHPKQLSATVGFAPFPDRCGGDEADYLPRDGTFPRVGLQRRTGGGGLSCDAIATSRFGAIEVLVARREQRLHIPPVGIESGGYAHADADLNGMASERYGLGANHFAKPFRLD